MAMLFCSMVSGVHSERFSGAKLLPSVTSDLTSMLYCTEMQYFIFCEEAARQRYSAVSFGEDLEAHPECREALEATQRGTLRSSRSRTSFVKRDSPSIAKRWDIAKRLRPKGSAKRQGQEFTRRNHRSSAERQGQGVREARSEKREALRPPEFRAAAGVYEVEAALCEFRELELELIQTHITQKKIVR